MKRKGVAAYFVLFLLSIAVLFAEDGKEDKLELTGSLEQEYSFFGARKDSPIYELQYFGKNKPDILSAYPLTFYLNGDYETREIGVHIKTATMASGDNEPAFSLLELYGNYHFSDSSILQSGKRTLKWGKGYAFNPTAYVSRAKDPEDPEATMEGYPLINYQYSRSLQSEVLNNFALDLVVLPAGATASSKSSDAEYTSAAGKLYFLLWDTDLDFMVYYGKKEPFKYGADLSRNLSSGFEIHGEFSRFQDQSKYTMAGSTLHTEKVNGFSYLAGFRWLNEWNITTIFEYYHYDAGLTKDEFRAYQSFLAQAVMTSTSTAVAQAMTMNKAYFSVLNSMKDYLYLKISKPEPFDLVDVSLSAYSIYNIGDGSSSVGFLLSYKPVTNLEVVFEPIVLVGQEDSEFGSKQYQYKMILQAKFAF